MTDKLLDMQVFIENEKLKIHRLKKDIENIRRGDFMKQQFEISLIETAPVNIVSLRETIAIKDFSILMKKVFEGLPCEGITNCNISLPRSLTQNQLMLKLVFPLM